VLSERRARSREFFAGAAGRWDRLRDELFGRRTSLLGLLGLIDPDHVIADLGCGTGAVTEALAPIIDRMVAVDGSEAMLDAARERLAQHAHVDLRRGELEALPIEPETIDLATLILVLHHLPDPGKVVTEVARILRPSGRILIVDMLPHDREEYRHEMGHVWLGFSEERIRAYLDRAGFGAIRFRALPPEPGAQGPMLFAASASPAVGGPARAPDDSRNSRG
jgi:ArsR family transcriptional regulator